MIDQTNSHIQRQEGAVRRHNKRRYAFHSMLQATDRLLWRLEEMNRDGVKTVAPRVRNELRMLAASVPSEVRKPLRETGSVQDTLDSLFEVQERLFRWRYPNWEDWDPDEQLVS